MSEPPSTREGQLPLPMATPDEPPAPGRRRRRRRRPARPDPQLWLFAPYLQPELPLTPPPSDHER